jgi:hypothetical protein
VPREECVRRLLEAFVREDRRDRARRLLDHPDRVVVDRVVVVAAAVAIFKPGNDPTRILNCETKKRRTSPRNERRVFRGPFSICRLRRLWTDLQKVKAIACP